MAHQDQPQALTLSVSPAQVHRDLEIHAAKLFIIKVYWYPIDDPADTLGLFDTLQYSGNLTLVYIKNYHHEEIHLFCPTSNY